MSAAFQFVRQLGNDLAKGEFDFPPFPDTAMRVQECINDPDSDIQKLASVVATEPALAARLMRMANSALMRRGPMEVTEISVAISRVGMGMVQNAAVSFAAREAFQFPPGSPFLDDLNHLRQHSVKVASYGYCIAKQCAYDGKPEEAMLAGLLHAVGKSYIFMKSADHPDLFADRATLETLVAQWHTGVARAIVESWEFPESIAVGIDEQELEDRDRDEPAELSDVLLIADRLARGGPASASALGDLDSLVRLRTTGDQLASTLEAQEEEIQSMIDALGG